MSLRKHFTDALVADCRWRYEHTDEPIASIARRMGVHRTTFNAYVHDWAWKMRKDRPPRDLVPAENEVAAEPQADDVVSAEAPAEPKTPAHQTHALPADAPLGHAAPGDAPLRLVHRVERAVEHDLAAVERVIAQLRTGRGSAQDAERAARTLASLSRTLKEISGLRGADSADDGGDDIPRDIDELRRILAERIDRLEREEDGEGDHGQPGLE